MLFLAFLFVLPTIQIILFCVAIGNSPSGLSMSVVNEDTGIIANMYLKELDSHAIHQVFSLAAITVLIDLVRSAQGTSLTPVKQCGRGMPGASCTFRNTLAQLYYSATAVVVGQARQSTKAASVFNWTIPIRKYPLLLW